MDGDLSVRQRLEQDLKDAMRAGDQTSRDTIRFLLAAIKNAEIDRGGPLGRAEAISVIQKQAKQRQDSIDQFRAGGRPDLVEREQAQLSVVERYLPAELTDDEVVALVAEVLADVGATSQKDLGRVMPALIERAAGRADGRRLNAAARAALSG